MIYFDTSYMLKCYLSEHGHEEVTHLWKQADAVVCCELGKAEFVAAVHRHLREGRITDVGLQTTLAAWQEDQAADLWDWFPLNEEVFTEVTKLFSTLPNSIYLRSADAIHLACVRMLGLQEIYSNDRHLVKARAHLGLTPHNVIP